MKKKKCGHKKRCTCGKFSSAKYNDVHVTFEPTSDGKFRLTKWCKPKGGKG